MSTRFDQGELVTSSAPNGLDCDIFDVVDEDGTVSVVIYFPRDVWEDASYDEDAQLELINEYTFPDWCILSANWEEAGGAADANDEIAIDAEITFDLSD